MARRSHPASRETRAAGDRFSFFPVVNRPFPHRVESPFPNIMSRFHCIFLMACTLAVPPLAAGPAVVITPGNIAGRIRSQNPDLAAARLRIDEVTGRMTQSGRLDNPELELGLEHNSQFREGRFEIGFSQRFPVTGRLRIEKEITLTELKAAEAEVREVERQLVAKARELLVKVLATRLRRELLREQSAVAKEFADFLGETAAKGEGSPLDAGQARIEATRLTTELRQLDAAEAALAGELKPLLGMHAGQALQVSGQLAAPVMPAGAADPLACTPARPCKSAASSPHR